MDAVVPGEQAIILIDSGEFQACAYAQLILLPVQWCGPMPAMGDLIRIEGQAQEVEGKLMFVADKLEKVTNL